MSDSIPNAATDQALKILADGSEVPATDPRTDHVAVLFPDGWMVACRPLTDTDGESLPNADAVDAAAAALDLLGHNDWQTAPLDEVWLRHILKHDRYDPALDSNLFPNLARGDWYWTGTNTPWSKDTASSSASSAFGVFLGLGHVGSVPRYLSGFGLACRRARQ
ncbi:DUF1566 domain-containing protein [Luteimonas sp. FCS-9]|uniref:DUF1566 domain-containing protein n=1 Tax=Luteimonas sp. FCS-9 TaxID=1547516 RepID=UPI00063EAFC4|nr:DUF1566 domain-containing protein [Luteimonas sp. FCS-9]KLJ02856.1 hypothetical protein WQ56_00820 [Luteimonas sp. FCS-9]